jgi:DNA polymerase/3'-5' exonuclease PolX
MDKSQIAEILAEIGTLLELKGEVVFKTRAYANAARTIESLSEPLDKIIAENRLGEIKGIGEALQKKITELAATGKLAYYDELKASIPPGLLDMLQIPGLGPKKVKALHDKLGVETVERAGSRLRVPGRWRSWTASAKRRKPKFWRASSFAANTPRAICSPPRWRPPDRFWTVYARTRTWCVAARRAACGVARNSLATLIFWLPPKTPPR